jgi:hypothetical protein
MQVKTKTIALSLIKFQEKAMVKCFTKVAWIKSYFVRDAFQDERDQTK